MRELILDLQEKYKIKRITDLLALAPQNDPFGIGTEDQRQKAQWFKNIFEQVGNIGKSAKPKSKLGLLERTANGGYKCAVHGDLSSNFIVNGKCGRCLAKERLRPALGVGGSRLLDDETEAKERELSSATVRDAGAD